MGYYLANHRLPPAALESMFTAREYCLAAKAVERQFIGGHLNDPLGAWRGPRKPAFDHFKIGNFSLAVSLLRGLARQQPSNWRLQRLIGLTRFFQGHPIAAQKHFELARQLVRRERAVSGSLRRALHLHLEGAFLRYSLLCVYLRLGWSREARALVEEDRQDL